MSAPEDATGGARNASGALAYPVFTLSLVHPRRWTVAAIILFAFAVTWGVDRRLKSASITGYAPGDAQWTIAADDVDVFLRLLTDTRLLGRVQEPLRTPFREFALAVRQHIGVRPTPDRWKRLFGGRFVAARNGAGIGFCFRPGLFLRALEQFQADNDVFRGGGKLRRRGEFFYAWREGFLIVSRSPELVLSMLDGPSVGPSGAEDCLVITNYGLTPWEAVIEAGEGLPIRGFIEMAGGVSGALFVPKALTDEAILAVTAADPTVVADLWTRLLLLFPAGEFLTRALEEAGNPFRPYLGQEARCVTAALVGVDTAEPFPVPEVVMVNMDARAPAKPPDAAPYEWSGYWGWMQPLAGEKLTLCVAESGQHTYLTSRSSLMSRYVVSPAAWGSAEGDLHVQISWRRAASVARELLAAAGEYDLTGEWNAEEAQRWLGPFLDAAEELGVLELVARRDAHRLAFSGHVARELVEDATAP